MSTPEPSVRFVSDLLKLCTVCLIAFTGLSLPGTVFASDWGVVVNGKSYHAGAARDWNESNWGLGFEREFDARRRWVKVVVGNGFRDSQDEMSYMAGGGVKRRFHIPRIGPDFYVDLGAVGFLMTRQDINENQPFPGLLPTMTVGTRRVAVNMAYLPGGAAHSVSGVRSLDPNLDAIYFVQLRLNADLFAPIGSRLRARFAGLRGR